MASSKAALGLATRSIAACAALIVGAGLAASASAQNYPITPEQRSTAEQVANAGVPLSELAPDAPDSYTVKPGDTLWHISGIFLRSPWRWPELWGMNLEQVRNPHRIYPGQTLYLEKLEGRARLRAGQPPSGAPTETVRVSPRVRLDSLPETNIPTLPPQVIEPFLNEAILVEDAGVLDRAPRIVSAPEDRVLLTQGDRAYVRGRNGTPVTEADVRGADQYRVFRNAVALQDPVTKQVLGYEAKYLGNAELVRGESVQQVLTDSGRVEPSLVPATVDILRAKEEMRVGDRLLPEPPRVFTSYVPRAPAAPVDGNIISVYGDAVNLVGQYQVVVINRGAAEGIENGNVMSILKTGRRVLDRSQQGERAVLKLPDERSGLLMVFRTFQHLSYALVLEITEPLAVGDRITNPR
jgi:hypothetical protein